MPSRYYNPRLAKNLADAYKQEVLDLATPVERAFQPFVQLTKEMYEQRMKEKEKYEKQKEKIQAEQNAYFDKMAIVDPNTLDPSLQNHATMDVMNKQMEYRWAVENLQGYDRIVRTKEINNGIGVWSKYNQNLANYQQEYIDRRNPDQEGGDRTSKVNSSVVLEMDRRKANKDFQDIVKGEDGLYYAVFMPQEDSAIEEPVMVGLHEWQDAYKPMERQTKKYVDAISTFDDMINTAKREERWETDPENKSQIESKLESLEFTKDEALSIAVDHLGMSEESYAGVISQDLDDDGVPGTIDDINTWVKDQLRQGALTTLKNLREAKEKAIEKAREGSEPTLTQAQIKELQRVESYNYVGDKLTTFVDSVLEGQPDIIKMNAPNFIGIETKAFEDFASGLGFSGFVTIKENEKVIAIEVTNDKTNDKAYIPIASNAEMVIKRLMIAAGATPQEADAYFYEKLKQSTTLPGLEQD